MRPSNFATPSLFGTTAAIAEKNWIVLRPPLLHPVPMKKRLTAKQISSFPCPTCGVAPGMPCERYSGAQRRQPHVDRRFVATEALVQEAETVHAGPSKRKSNRSSN